ncbi:MAG TPA: putative sulfate exporter family transporter [Thermoanaerobaculia bacterium]|nr:putative sulfate exporter family transporter [Thermoanaerobaculia bacterium]
MTPGHVLVPLLAVVAALPFVPPAAALVSGILVALAAGNPWLSGTRRFAHVLLGLAVMGLGGAADLGVVGRVGARGIGYTAVGIGLTFCAGLLIARLLGVEEDTSLLVTAGTAICGGSAIAAVAPAIKARSESISIALATVFLLNAVALVVFPPLGHYAGLDEQRFGLFAALAIHDTSSVVGAATAYGPKAVEVATTVKLARALWIVPVALVAGWARGRRTGERGKSAAKLPWFLVGFVAMAALVSGLPALRPAGLAVAAGARRVLVVTLFLIGTSLTRDAVRRVGLKPVVLGVALWILAASATLAALKARWIS